MQEGQLTACGIIAEYNPLHNGHVYQLQQAKSKTQADVMIVVMSGNYVQRGQPALLDKWLRAQMALAAGADLVVELPFSAASQPADLFSDGAIKILADLGCRFLAFGTEDTAIDYQKLGQAMLKLPPRQAFFVDYKKTYATQFNELLQAELGFNLTQPNMLLAASYAKSVAMIQPQMQLVPIQRLGVAHDAQAVQAKFASASWLRQHLLTSDQPLSSLTPYLPATSWQILKAHQADFLSWDSYFPFLKYQLTMMTLPQLGGIYQVTEGLEYRIKHVLRQCQTFDALLTAVKTKRYTYARLQRVFLYSLLNITDEMMQTSGLFIYPLAFNAKGRQYLHQVKKQLTLPWITRINGKNTKPEAPFYLQNRVDLLVEQFTSRHQNFGRRPIYQP